MVRQEIMPDINPKGRPQEGEPLPTEVLKEKYQNIRSEMETHVGELVLMSARHWDPEGADMPESRMTYGLQTNYYLGTVTPPFMEIPKLSSLSVEIQTPKHAHFRLHSKEPVLKQGEITEPWMSYFDLERKAKITSGYPYFHANELLLEIVVGDQNVSEWMSKEIKTGNFSDFDRAEVEKNPLLSDELSKHLFAQDRREAFSKMLALIGRQDIALPDPPKK